MANLTTVRNALASQIAEYANPQIPAFGQIPDQINPPCAIVLPSRAVARYGMTLVGNVSTQFSVPIMAATDINLDVMVLVARASTIDRVQDTLDQWLGFEYDADITSIPMAIAKDDSLGGTVDYCIPVNCDSYGPIEWNGTTYFGARIHCQVGLE
jgi:hypothetical protein